MLITERFSNALLVLMLLLYSSGTIARDLEITSSLGTGNGELKWSIADPSGDPDVLSELIYDAERLYIANIDARITVPRGHLKNLVLGVRADYNYIAKGSSEDRDWNESGRNDLYSYSNAEIYGKNLNAYELYLGYLIHLNDTLSLTPRVAYHRSEQTFHVRNGVQISSEPPQTTPTGPIEGLDSSYAAQWEGLKVGAELNLTLSDTLSARLSADFLELDYDAKANWNLRDDFAHPVSFRHQAESDRAYRINTQLGYRLSSKSSINGWLRYESFETDAGTDTIFFANGNRVQTTLNEAVWESWGIGVGFTRGF
ncbi:MAG: hypothetical protein C9356_01730 [Oleiphilus sp.]|nr:MAG: hypothetical protein C9356_01730 [Oleiphilus sp.]